jgi:hypothetical protein
MVRAFAERVDLNWGPHPGNIVAPESIPYVESLRMTSRAIEGRPERRGYGQPLGAWVILPSSLSAGRSGHKGQTRAKLTSTGIATT